MARQFAAPEAQQLFKTPTAYTPTSSAIQSSNEAFESALDNKLNQQYTSLADQYENRQISDNGFAAQLQAYVDASPSETIKQKWTPVVNQVRYTVFSNAQGLQDTQIQNAVASGQMTPQQAAQRYQAMSAAALAQNSQSAIRDAATWQLKGNQLLESARRSGSGSRGLGAEDLYKVNENFDYLDYLKNKADQLKTTTNAALNDPSYFSGMTTSEAKTERELLQKESSKAMDDYYSAQEKFYTSDLFYDYYNENTDTARQRVNTNLNYVHQQGGQVFVPSYYDVGYTPDETPTATQESGPRVTQEAASAIDSALGGTSYGPRRQNSSTPVSFNLPTVAPQTQYQSNPLGLNGGAPTARSGALA